MLPVYKTSQFIPELYGQLSKVLEETKMGYELIFIDDGSPDDSFSKLASIAKSDSRVKVIRLSKNYGQHAAIATGMSHARGELAIVMDADMQDSPDLIPKFISSYRQGNNIVVSVRETSTGSLFRRAGSFFVRKICKLYTRLPNKFYYGSYILIDRSVIDQYLLQPDRHHYFLKILDRLEGEIGFVKYSQKDPEQTRSSYSITKLIRLFSMLISNEEIEKFSSRLAILSVLGSGLVFASCLAPSSQASIHSIGFYLLLLLTAVSYVGAFVSAFLLKNKRNRKFISSTQIGERLNLDRKNVANIV